MYNEDDDEKGHWLSCHFIEEETETAFITDTTDTHNSSFCILVQSFSFPKQINESHPSYQFFADSWNLIAYINQFIF